MMDKKNKILLYGLTFFVLAGWKPLAVLAVQKQIPKEREKRERAMDRIAHIEESVIRTLPDVPHLCNQAHAQKAKVDIGDCNLTAVILASCLLRC